MTLIMYFLGVVQQQVKQSAPPPVPAPQPPMPATSNVIVVDTGKLKDLSNTQNKGTFTV